MKTSKEEKKQADLLRWILHEWDCSTLDEAKKLAQTDYQLHLRLRSAGVCFSDSKSFVNSRIHKII